MFYFQGTQSRNTTVVSVEKHAYRCPHSKDTKSLISVSFCHSYIHNVRMTMNNPIFSADDDLRKKAFKCEHCDKAFTDRGNLKKHQNLHLGKRRNREKDEPAIPQW